jgi:hypothetical protein
MARAKLIESDLSNLTVGEFYNIRCAKLINHLGTFIKYVPVIGDAHRDKQFGFDYTHLHIDGRFASSNPASDYSVREDGTTNGVVLFGEVADCNHFAKEIVVRKMKCRRLGTGINPPVEAKKYFDWKKSMIGKSCKGKKCPHLGFEMIESNGLLVCQLHNLIGSIDTETIIC